MRTVSLVTLTLLTVACGKGGIVAKAEKAADAACACSEAQCAMDVVAAFNKESFNAADEKAALSAEDKAKFDAAVDKMSECRDKLK